MISTNYSRKMKFGFALFRTNSQHRSSVRIDYDLNWI